MSNEVLSQDEILKALSRLPESRKEKKIFLDKLVSYGSSKLSDLFEQYSVGQIEFIVLNYFPQLVN
jgi:hypothetical protein